MAAMDEDASAAIDLAAEPPDVGLAWCFRGLGGFNLTGADPVNRAALLSLHASLVTRLPLFDGMFACSQVASSAVGRDVDYVLVYLKDAAALSKFVEAADKEPPLGVLEVRLSYDIAKGAKIERREVSVQICKEDDAYSKLQRFVEAAATGGALSTTRADGVRGRLVLRDTRAINLQNSAYREAIVGLVKARLFGRLY